MQDCFVSFLYMFEGDKKDGIEFAPDYCKLNFYCITNCFSESNIED